MTKRIIFLWSFIALLTVINYKQSDSQDFPQEYSLHNTIKKVKKSIVYVKVGTNFSDIEKNSSGFIIHPNGYITTCAHIFNQEKFTNQNKYKDTVNVIPDTNKIYIKLSDSLQFLKANLIGIRPDRDAAILKIIQDSATSKSYSFNYLSLGSVNDVEEGKEIATTGYDLMGQPVEAFGKQIYQITTHKGIVSSILDIGPTEEKFLNSFQVDLMVSGGASGSPIYDVKDGTVIGMVCSIVGSISECIPAWVIEGMMSDLLKK
jgi:S1-C subfamily serine protease